MALSKRDQEIHDEMLTKLLPFVEFLKAENFGFWLTIAREGTCANYCGGAKSEAVSAVSELIGRNSQIADVLQKALDAQLD